MPHDHVPLEDRDHEALARAEGWEVTLNHHDAYVAHHGDDEDPTHVLDADDEAGAWQELCGLEGLAPRPKA